MMKYEWSSKITIFIVSSKCLHQTNYEILSSIRLRGWIMDWKRGLVNLINLGQRTIFSHIRHIDSKMFGIFQQHNIREKTSLKLAWESKIFFLRLFILLLSSLLTSVSSGVGPILILPALITARLCHGVFVTAHLGWSECHWKQ